MSVTVNGSGGVDLVKSTPGDATADKIANGFTAWVNGKKIVGTADIGKTVVQEMSGSLDYTFNFDGTPKAILAEFGYNGSVGNYGTFVKILDVSYKNSAGSPGQDVTFGSNYVRMRFTSAMGSAYTPYFKVTAIF